MSKKYKLDKADINKILVGALIASTGALLTYMTEAISQTDFGEYTSVVVVMWSVIANIIRKYLVQS